MFMLWLLSELTIEQDRSSRISTIAVQWSKQNKAGSGFLIQMNNQLLIYFSFHFKHYVRLLFPCLPKCFGTFFHLAKQYLHFFQDFECYDNVCLCQSGGLHNLYLIASLQFNCNSQDVSWERRQPERVNVPSILPGLGKSYDWRWEKHNYSANISCCSFDLHYAASPNPTAEFNLSLYIYWQLS